MLNEADVAAATSPRAAVMLAWAGLEAALRRVASRAGLSARIGVQPLMLLRELRSADELDENEFVFLEHARQLRTAIAHGMKSPHVDKAVVDRLVNLGRRLLDRSNGQLKLG